MILIEVSPVFFPEAHEETLFWVFHLTVSQAGPPVGAGESLVDGDCICTS